jgi:hypothetical protein
LAGKKIEGDAKTSAFQRIWGQLETETFVQSGVRMGLGRQKIERRRRSGRVLTGTIEWREDEAG